MKKTKFWVCIVQQGWIEGEKIACPHLVLSKLGYQVRCYEQKTKIKSFFAETPRRLTQGKFGREKNEAEFTHFHTM